MGADKPDVEKVRKGLECCRKAGAVYTGELGITAGDECTVECPYREEGAHGYCLENLIQDCLLIISRAQQPL